MKKVIVAAGVFVLALVALRRYGPALGKRAMRNCEEMFERMPEESPPKRMMRQLEKIREQNSQILHHLEEEQTTLAGVP